MEFGVASKRLGYSILKNEYLLLWYASDHCVSPSILGPSKPLQAGGVREREKRTKYKLFNFRPHPHPVILCFSSCRSIVHTLYSNIGSNRNRLLPLLRCGVTAASGFIEFTTRCGRLTIVLPLQCLSVKGMLQMRIEGLNWRLIGS